MGTIHMEVERARMMARQLDQWAAHLDAYGHTLQSIAARVSTAWQGGHSDDYLRRLRTLLKNYNTQAQQLQSMSLRLSHEVDEWEAADGNSHSWFRNAGRNFRLPKFFVRPITWEAIVWGGVLIPIASKIGSGVHALYNTGQQAWHAAGEFVDDVGDAASRAVTSAVKASDSAIDGALTQYLKNSDPNSLSETVKFKIEGDVTIPGAVVGSAGSGKVVGATDASLTRNADGTYTLTMHAEAGAGVEADAAAAKLQGSIGKYKIGGGVDSGAEVIGKGEVEVSFDFDPKKPGDMTKLVAFTSSLGLTTVPGGQALVGPALYTMKDNLSGLKIGAGVDGSANVDVHALVKLAGVDVDTSSSSGIALDRVNGQWQSSNYAELSAGAHGKLLVVEGGFEVSTKVENIHDFGTGIDSAKVTVEIKPDVSVSTLESTPKDILMPKNLQKYLPELDLSKISSVKFDKSRAIVVEYTVNQPATDVQKLMTADNGQPDWKAINGGSTVQIKRLDATEFSASAEGKLGAATESAGLSVEGSVSRESEVLLWSSDAQ